MSKRQKRISVGLDKADYDKIKILADEMKISYSKYIGNIVREHLKIHDELDKAIVDIEVNNKVVETVNFDKNVKEILDFKHPDFINNVVEFAIKRAIEKYNYKGVF